MSPIELPTEDNKDSKESLDWGRLRALQGAVRDGVRQEWSQKTPDLDLHFREREEIVDRFLAAILAPSASLHSPETAAFRHVMADLRERLSIDKFFAVFSPLYWCARQELSKTDLPPEEMFRLSLVISRLVDTVLFESAKEWSLERDLTNRLKDELTGLYRIASAIITTPDSDQVLESVVEEILQLLKADFCALLANEDDGLDLKAVFPRTDVPAFSLENPLLAKAFEEGEALRGEAFGFSHLLVAPLRVRNHTLGLAVVGNQTERKFGESDAYLLSTICSQAAASLWNAQLFESNARISLDLVLTLAEALDARDSYTHNHSTNVAEISRRIAVELELDLDTVDDIYMAGLLHDIGKIGVADAVLHKPGSLSRAERLLMMQHPIKGAQILEPVKGLRRIVPGVKHHHERWDGSGYPDGLQGENIPLSARILGLADAYDVMCHHRVYRRARSPEEIVEELHRSNGKQFDPQMVQALLRIMEEGKAKGLKEAKEAKIAKSSKASKTASPRLEEPEKEDVLGELLAFGRELSGCLTPEGVMQRAVGIAKKLIGSDVASIWLAQEGGSLSFSASAGRSRPPAEEIIRVGEEGLVGYVAYRRIATAVSDYRSEERFPVPFWIHDEGFSSALAVPIEQGDRLVGVLIVHARNPQHFNNDSVRILETIASYVALALDGATLKATYQRQTLIDPLTGLSNHRHFQEKLGIELEHARRTGHPLGLLHLNLDHFRLFNEQHGHVQGDEALRQISEILRWHQTPGELAARFGGEEFMLLLPNQTQEQATERAETIREAINRHGFLGKDQSAVSLTVSIGVTAFPDPSRDPGFVLTDAAAALSRAKSAGRNRVWVR